MAARSDLDARALAREAARNLAEALGQWAALHGGGRRALVRRQLTWAIDQAERARALATADGDGAIIAEARRTLVEAHAAWAEDAFQGAGQLSLSAQRAPTREACDDGWRRVEAIADGALASADVAAIIAREIAEDATRPSVTRAASIAARRAEASARGARMLVEARNHAYTFHTDNAFSFGEGWHVAAAAVLEGVAIQIEPAKPWTPEADRFLRDAGLGDRLQTYRSRARTVKQTTAIVARAFEDDALAARRRLRAAFIGADAIPRTVTDWADRRLAGVDKSKKVLLWIRDAAHDAGRNTTRAELDDLIRRAHSAGLVPVMIGDSVPGGGTPDAVDMTLFWMDEIFRGEHARRAQLQLFEHLEEAHGLVGQLGVTTAGMDGPALMGLPTIYVTHATNVRLRAWVGAVPGYHEIVRETGYLDRVGDMLQTWASGRVAA